MSERGHRLSPASSLGLVNAIFCSTGIPAKGGASCLNRSDPRGFGLSIGGQ
ncbi:MAG: hypothetical protein H8E39_01625 [Alphaproteobacteria bacterium]|nr:hypothetical protein [Alphaproteobacteria bacterium]